MAHPKKLCMFCGKGPRPGDKLTSEHFVPKCLWDKERPTLMRTVPAHRSCNGAFAADNEYFRDVLILEAGAHEHPEVIKLHQNSFQRKLTNQYGRVRSTLKDLSLRPAFSKGGLYLGHAPAFDCDWPRMIRVLQNVMRGIYFTVKKEPMPLDMQFNISVPYDSPRNRELVEPMMPWQGFGDDVFACRYGFNTEYPGSIACLMKFYQYRMFLGFAMPKRFLNQSYSA